MRLRIACVQFNPTLGKLESNIAKVKKLVSSSSKKFDLLVLPELALTGYNFKSSSEIEPFLEQPDQGPTYKLARELCRAHNCITVAGYPEEYQGTVYNSAIVVNRDGELLHNYRKTHLYETDKTWGASENPKKDFHGLTLDFGDSSPVAANIGICMDLNPYEFEAPFNKFEFSLSCWEQRARLIIVPTAWLSSDSPSINEEIGADQKTAQAKEWQEKFSRSTIDGSEPSSLLLNYWLLRFFPFMAHPMNQLPKLPNKTTVVICNRTGIEDDVLYGGSSAVLQFNPAAPEDDSVDMTNKSVEVVSLAGWATEELMYTEVEI